MEKTAKGFTLIELMIAVAIIGILAAIAYPSYNEYVRKAHRAEIAGILSEQAQNLERFYSKNGVYSAAPITGTNDYYTVGSTLNAQDFTLTGTPKAGIMSNDKCGTFSITNTGARGNTVGATKDCWGR